MHIKRVYIHPHTVRLWRWVLLQIQRLGAALQAKKEMHLCT
jgi:hypothetical protein